MKFTNVAAGRGLHIAVVLRWYNFLCAFNKPCQC